MKSKVSIILPSLNVSKYIRECLESVVNQTLHDIEIICVDAGSTDGTLEILKEYKRKDERIQVLISDKKSYGYQMNLGISAAEGEYIGIVETDDYISTEMYEELYSAAKENDVDLVKADFYRFTRENGKENRGYYKLTSDTGYYNLVIKPSDKPVCFTFLMNTWSGIYNREFLKKNNIVHNESPGASYQDNGFWFQTFMYAEKAYFVNKAYYMNRRDNENSSVYQRDKIYCICEEYDFIYNKLINDMTKFNKVKEIFGYACFRAYQGNFQRVADIYQEELIYKSSKILSTYNLAGVFNQKYFREEEWKELQLLLNDPKLFYCCKVEARDRLLSVIEDYCQVIIYGAGMVGKQVLQQIIDSGKGSKVIGFAVSNIEDNVASFKGYPIKPISYYEKIKKNVLVIIATTKIYQTEIEKILIEKNFSNRFLLDSKR